jgi:NADPH:quinone reductase-like Zn-dependent oxidoreductase
MGCFEGWWAGVEEGRVERPVIQEDGWDAKLRQSGFQGIKSAVRDNKHPHFFHTSNILARVQSDDISTSSPIDNAKTRLTLLKPSSELSEFGQSIKSTLEAEGYNLDEYIWGEKLPDEQDIVSLMDVDPERAPLLADIDAQDLTSFIDTLGDVVPGQAVIWLMRPAQIQCSDPQYGQMPGVARCVRAELAIDLVTLELDKLDGEATSIVARILRKVQEAQKAATDQDSLDIETEFVWRDGQVLVSRIHTSSVEQALADAATPAEARHLVIGQPGMLQTMRWVGHPLPPLAADHVQIRIKATGMNFHDVAVAIGIVGPDGDMEKDGYHGLGSEGTAIVTAIGADVKHVAVGDRVVCMEISTSCFATEKQLPSGLVARAPEGLSDEDAAGLWIPYTTVLWSYLEKAHLKRGQTVLIHSAAGGVGIAAIHVARWLGADFYCTVGSQAKIDFLTTVHGVPRERIFNSRDDSFVGDVMRATGGVGVDVILNSHSGELLHASWKCVAINGCMIDLGKRDFLGRGRLEMLPFVGNRAFFGVDLAYMIVNQKHKLMPYLQQAIDLFREGKLFPLHPTTVFEADKIQDAFRYMQKGVHMGRIVVRMPEDPASLPLTLPTPKPTFSADAVYLVAGGLGGLGQSILRWMATHGARYLVVMSPSAGTRDEHLQFVDELAELGCKLRCFAGDVADADFVRLVVAAASASGRPIKGVLQLAMQLRDTGFLNMDHDVWSTVTSPKVRGTWNLHHLLPKDLDFFIMCGSTSGTLGSYGQANYAAANTYLDAFLHFRHGLGLAATTLDIAAIGDIGYVACNKNVAERLGRAVARFMTEGEFLTCLQLAVERSDTKYIAPVAPTPTMAFEEASQLILYNDTVLPFSDPRNTTSWRRDPRLSVFRNNQGVAAQGTGTGSEGLRSFLGSLTTEPERLDEPETVTFFAEEIGKRIFSFLMKEDAAIDVSQTLSAMGADSLVAIEIRNWWKQTLAIDITVLELSDASSTMEHLGEMAVQRLKEKFASK